MSLSLLCQRILSAILENGGFYEYWTIYMRPICRSDYVRLTEDRGSEAPPQNDILRFDTKDR